MEDNQAPLQVEIDEIIARGLYTNLALITHSETEFLLDLCSSSRRRRRPRCSPA